MIATLVILIGMGAITISCKKDRRVIRKAELIVENGYEYRLGEDDEDPVIQGRVKKKKSLAPVDSTFVETISNATKNTIMSSYTNNQGEFTHQVPADTYYFRITIPGEPVPFITDTVRVTTNKRVLILLE